MDVESGEFRTSHSMIDGIVSGDEQRYTEAFKRFCERYTPMIRAWCHGWFRSAADADDAAQEIFLQLHNKLRRYRRREGTPFRNWLGRVSKNIATDLRKKAAKAKEKYGFEELPERIDSAADDSYVERLFLMEERRQFLEANAFQLNETERILVADMMTETPSSLTAGKLGKDENAVNQAKHRLRKKLRERFETSALSRGMAYSDLFPDDEVSDG